MTQPFEQPVNPFTQAQKEEQSEKLKYMSEVNKRLRDQIIAVFANPHGLQLLNTLEDIFLRQPVCPPGCVEGYGYKREGENSLIIRFRAVVDSAMNPNGEG